MVPESFHDFFLGATSVAGALIGLLFVAISVTPAAVTDKAENIEHRARATAAMSAFLNALLLSLLALIPDINLSPGALVLSTVGIVSTAALVITVLTAALSPATRHVISGNRWVRAVLWLVLLLGAYIAQFVTARSLTPHQPDPGDLTNLAVIVIVLFAIGVSRAWELVGARSVRVLASLRGAAEELYERQGKTDDTSADG